MRDSDFSSIDDYTSEPTAEDYNDSTTSTGASFGMGSGDDFATGNAGNFTIGIDPNRMSDNMFTNYVNAGSSNVPNVFDLGGGVGDFGFGNTRSQNFLNPQLAEMYKQQEIARTGVNLDKNPFVDSIFTDLFGDSIDRTKDLGSRRVQEINDLRARQAFGLPSLNTGKAYTSKDFEAGRDTQQGMVQELPMGGIERFARAFTPYGAMLPTRAAPVQSQMYRDAQTEAAAPGIIDQVGSTLSEFGDSVYESLGEIGGGIKKDFLTGITKMSDFFMDDKFSGSNLNSGVFSAGDNSAAKVEKEQLDSMNRGGTGYASAAGSLYPRTTENSPNYTVPGEENLGMTIDRTGLDRYNLNSVDPNFKTEMNKLNSDEREFLTGRTDNIGIASLDPEVTDSVKNNMVSDAIANTTGFMGDKNALNASQYLDNYRKEIQDELDRRNRERFSR